MAAGGSVSFNCATATTITVATTKTVGKTTSIDGRGRLTFSGGGGQGIFYLAPSTGSAIFSVANVAFKSAHHGAIYIWSNVNTLNVTNSTFSGNAGGYGAAISGGGVGLNITNSIFSGNGTTGSGNPTADNGGAISWNGPMKIVGSPFDNNWAANAGGAIAGAPPVGNTWTIDRSTFTGNR